MSLYAWVANNCERAGLPPLHDWEAVDWPDPITSDMEDSIAEDRAFRELGVWAVRNGIVTA